MRRAIRSRNPPARKARLQGQARVAEHQQEGVRQQRRRGRAIGRAAADKAGGQPSNSQGTGSAGQNTDAEQGGGKANTPARAKPATKAAIRPKASRPTARASPAASAATATRRSRADRSPAPATGKQDRSGPQSMRQSKAMPLRPKTRHQQTPGEQNPAEQRRPEVPATTQQGEPAKQSPDENPLGQRQQPPKGQPDKAGDQSQPPGNRRAKRIPGGAAGNPTGGGGMPPDQVTPPQGKAAPNEQGEDEANLDYSRKATDLALDISRTR